MAQLIGTLVKVEGTYFIITDTNDYIQRQIASGILWEPKLVRLLQERAALLNSIAPERSTSRRGHLVNVGAHIGTVCVPVARDFGLVTAIEPLASHIRHLALHARINMCDNIKVIDIAASNSTEDAHLIAVPQNSGATMIASASDVQTNNRFGRLHVPYVTVRRAPLDAMGLDLPPDIMVVDVEGHEEEFIEGAKNTLRTHKPLLIIELWTDEKRQEQRLLNGRTQEELIYDIIALGYQRCYVLHDDTYVFE